MNLIKLCLCIVAAMLTGTLIAGCTAPTTNTTPSPTTAHDQALPAALNAQISSRYQLVDNFTRISEANETPVYTAAFQDANGTLHSITLYLANSTDEAQAQFEAQKAAYGDVTAESNATVVANTTTHWEITTDTMAISVWYGEPKTSGPFGLTLDVPYVVVSQDAALPKQ